MVCAVLIWFGLPNDPAESYFLTAEEKWMMRVRNEQRRKYMGSDKFNWEEMWTALRDPKLAFSAATQFCQDILLYGFSTFLPTILQDIGYNSLMSNVLTVPVYIWAALVFIAVAYCYILLLAVSNNPVKYFATYLCAIACYTCVGLNVAWLNVNFAPQYRRALAVGVQQTIGNCAGIVAGQIYRKSPYVLGNSFSLGSICVAQILVFVHAMYLRRENAEKERIIDGKEDTRRVRTVEDIIITEDIIIMVVVDSAWEWVAITIMAIMEVWEGLGLEVGIMEGITADIMAEEALVGIMAVDIMEEAGDLL
ncbi:hypothetical protein APSETT444_001646 [Aspergillus pseudonomiae]